MCSYPWQRCLCARALNISGTIRKKTDWHEQKKKHQQWWLVFKIKMPYNRHHTLMNKHLLTCGDLSRELESSFIFFSVSSLAVATLSSHSSFWDMMSALQWVLHRHTSKEMGPKNALSDSVLTQQMWQHLHVISEFFVEGFNVALATLQLLLQLSQVIVQLAQLSYSANTPTT